MKLLIIIILLILIGCSNNSKTYNIKTLKNGEKLVSNKNKVSSSDFKLILSNKIAINEFYLKTILPSFNDRWNKVFSLDSNNNIYYLDTHKKVIIKYSNGKEVFRFSKSGDGPGEMRIPDCILVNKDTINLYSNTYRKLSKFDTDGEFIEDVNNFFNPVIEKCLGNNENINIGEFAIEFIDNYYFIVTGFNIRADYVIKANMFDKGFNLIKDLYHKKIKINKDMNPADYMMFPYYVRDSVFYRAEYSKEKFNFEYTNLYTDKKTIVRKVYKKEAPLPFISKILKMDYYPAISSILCDKYKNVWINCSEDWPGITDSDKKAIFQVFNESGIYREI